MTKTGLRENFPFYLFCVLVTGLVIKIGIRQTNRRKKKQICAHRGLIEIRPKKWPSR